MITLATLNDATAQEVFDQAARHMMTQFKKSNMHGICAYRGENGLKCVAGCFIADDEYTPEMDIASNSSWSSLLHSNLRQHTKHDFLIIELQQIHDRGGSGWCGDLRYWSKQLFELAVIYELNADVLKEFKP
jgi:hypothetical protein